MRLFFGVELPEELRSEVGEVQSLLRPSAPDVRWVDPDVAHCTLKFLGDVAPDELESVVEAARPAAPFRPVALELKGLGTFPPRGPRIRVVWARLGGEVEALAAIQTQLDAATAELGFAPERHPWSPHVTLGRVRSRVPQRRLRTAIQEHRDRRIGTWRVRRYVLFESRLGPGGPRYEPVATYPFE